MSQRQLQKKVKSFFDDYAEEFNFIYESKRQSRFAKIVNKFTRSGMYHRFRYVYDVCVNIEAEKVLDVGCGPGQHDIILARECNIDLTGVDISPNMISQARRLAKIENVEERCNFILGNYIDIELNEKYDLVFSLGVLEYFLDPIVVLKRMANQTKSTFIFSLPVKWHFLTPQRILRYKIRRCPLFFYSRKGIELLLYRAGFNKFTITRFQRDFVVVVHI